MNVDVRAQRAATDLRQVVRPDAAAVMAAITGHRARARRRAALAIGAAVATAAVAGFLVVTDVGERGSAPPAINEPVQPRSDPVPSIPPRPVTGPDVPGQGLLVPISITAIPTSMTVMIDDQFVSFYGDDPAVPGSGMLIVSVFEAAVSGPENPVVEDLHDVDSVIDFLADHPQIAVTDRSELTVDERPAIRLELAQKQAPPSAEPEPPPRAIGPLSHSNGGADGFFPYRIDERASVVLLQLYDEVLVVERRDAPEEHFQQLIAGIRLP